MLLACLAAWPIALAAAAFGTDQEFVNSIGMKMLPIPAGSFDMGSTRPSANFDEQPVHHVTISHPFYLSQTPVTVEQFRQFKSDALLNDQYAPYAAGMSWHDAEAFCAWLSTKEHKTYRLPTEAEWEYACRRDPQKMLGFRQWCYDWYSRYLLGDQTDPVGSPEGLCKVVRGGPLDEPSKYSKPEDYLQPSSREGLAPDFAPYRDGFDPAHPYGLHGVGFRIVQADLPSTPERLAAIYPLRAVHQLTALATIGPDPNKPYFRKRRMLWMPPDDASDEAIRHAGLDPSLRNHNHSPAMEVMPNGDVLTVMYTSHNEYEPQVSLMASRLPFGADQWGMPSPFVDTPGANDHAPLLWRDGPVVYLFWGNPYLEGHFPFNYITSRNSGARWSSEFFPQVIGPIGPTTRPQPINTVLRDRDGTIYLPCDAPGAHSMLWATSDDGKTWHETGGRTDGRHGTFVLLHNGDFLALGRGSNIDGYMPQSLSHDHGKSYVISKTPFCALNSAQRPCILRLRSGNIICCGDYQPSKGTTKPIEIKESGCYIAISQDEGKTWRIKTLPGTQKGHHDSDTLGYSVLRQGPNGLIHLVTSLTHPALHFEMNEAWIWSDEATPNDDAHLMANTATEVRDVQSYTENYPDGSPHITYSAGIGNDGRFLLEGTETWFYPNGAKQRETQYHLGQEIGTESDWYMWGQLSTQWRYNPDGTSQWTTWWPNGRKRAQSTWKNLELIPGSDQFYAYPGQ
jgi:hypothetical protein